MENQDFLQLGTVNSSLPISGQQQGNLFSSDLLQPPDTRSNHSGSFSNQIETGIADVEIKPVEYDRYLYDNVFKATSELVTHTTSSEIPTSSDYSDPLTGDVTPVNNQAILDLAVTNANEQLESFASDAKFLEKMNLAFGANWQPQEAEAFIQDLASGETIPKIEVLPGADLKADGAFGENTIYLSEEFLSENAANPEVVASVLLEEIGHYVDQQLNSVDSPGDEGNIFVRIVQGETIDRTELAALKAEDDNTTISLDGEEVNVELASRTPYTIASGDTLTQIAQAELDDSSRWVDIEKEDGTTFTEEEAKSLQVGQVVYLPGQIGDSSSSPPSVDPSQPPPVDPPQPPPVDPPQPPPPPPPTDVVTIARQELEFFAQGALKETQEGAWQRIANEYWQTQGINRTDINTPEEVGDDVNNPWSAAFISWVMQEAGAGDQFNYSQLHADYINQAITDQGIDAAFIGHPIDAYSLQPGDLIGANRPDENGPNGNDIMVTYDDAVNTGGYSSHVDIVVATRPDKGEVDVIGGNVSNSVTLETYTIDSEGKLVNPDDGVASDDFFVVIENRFGENTPPLSPEPLAPPPEGIEFGDYDPVAAAPEFVTNEFLGKVFDISQRLEVAPEYLMAVMGFESAGTYNPGIVNENSGATGLIQFLPSTAEALGTTTTKLAALSAVEQLDYVEQYFSTYTGRLNSLEDTYLSVLYPAAIGKDEVFVEGTEEYEQNQGLDTNEDGVVTAEEAANNVRERLPVPELFAVYRGLATA